MYTQLLRCFLFFTLLSPLSAQHLRWYHHFYTKEAAFPRDMQSALDPDANFYTAGYLESPNDIGTVLANYLSNPEKGQFLYKVDSTGQPVWAKMILRGNVKVQSLESDSSGNLFVAGYFTGAVDFDPGPGDNTVNTLVKRMYFLQKLDTAGNLIWAKQFDTRNGNGYKNITTLDSEGNILIAGVFQDSVDFDPGPGVYALSHDNFGAGFFLKLDNDGQFIWVKKIDFINFISTIRSDQENAWVIFGNAYDKTDMDPGVDTFYQDPANFVLKLNMQGEFEWVRPFLNHPPEITVDNHGNIIMVGFFEDTVDFDPGPGEVIRTSFDDEQAYILKWSSAGEFRWVRIDPSTDEGFVVSEVAAVGPNESISLLGYHYGHINVNPDLGPYWLNSGLSNVGLIIQTLDAAGEWQGEMHVSYLNDAFDNRDYFLRYDAKGDLYVRATCSGSVQFDIDTSNVQYFSSQYLNEIDQLLFKITAPSVSYVSVGSELPTAAGVLFPNPAPAHSPLFLELPARVQPGTQLEIDFWDAKGALIQHYEGKVQTSMVRLQGLPPGRYAVRVKLGQMVQSTWWVVE